MKSKEVLGMVALFAILAMVADASSQELDKKIIINLQYNSGTEWDSDDDGVESLEGVVDMTVKNSFVDQSLDEGNLCTVWSVSSEEVNSVCHGFQDCCTLFELTPSQKSWDDPFYLHYKRYGATKNNKVKAQIFHVDMDAVDLDFHHSSALELLVRFVNSQPVRNVDITVARELKDYSSIRIIITNFGKEAIEDVDVGLVGVEHDYYYVDRIDSGSNTLIEVAANHAPPKVIIYLNNQLVKEEWL